MRVLILTLVLTALSACGGTVGRSPEFEEARRRDPAAAMRMRQEAEHVRVTDNPEAVRGCKFLGNVRSLGHATRSTLDLQFKTVALGGNTVFTTNTQAGREIHGDSYACAEQH